MRRFIILILVVLLAGLPALAEIQINDILDEFNIYVSMFGNPDLDPENADIRISDDGEWTAKIPCAEKAVDIFFAAHDGVNVNFMMCTCADEAMLTDYLAYCCATVLYCYGRTNITDMFGHILFNYMEIRADAESTAYISNAGDVFRLEYEDGVYRFSVMIAD